VATRPGSGNGVGLGKGHGNGSGVPRIRRRPPQPGRPLPEQHLVEVVDGLAHLSVDFHPVLHRAAGVHDSPVVAAAEGITDLAQRALGVLAGEEHGHLAREGDALGPALALHVRQADVVVLGHPALDLLDGEVSTPLLLEDLAEQALDILRLDRSTGQLAEAGHAEEGTLEATHIRPNVVGKELEDLRLEPDLHGGHLLAEDGHAGFDVRGLKVGGHAPLEAGDQALLESGNLARGPITAEHDLFSGLVQRVEGVEELLLDPFLPGQELDVVHQKGIHLAIPTAELGQVVVLEGVDELVGEAFAAGVDDLVAAFLLEDLVADGVEEVGLAEPDTTEEEEGIEGPARVLGHRERGAVGHLAVVAHHEARKGAVLVEQGLGVAARGPRVASPAFRGLRGLLHVRLGLRFRGLDRFGGGFLDQELDPDRLHGHPACRGPQEVEVVVRQPDRAELVTNPQLEQVAFEGEGTKPLEPQGVVVGPQHSLELGLDGGPHLFGGFGNGLVLRHVW